MLYTETTFWNEWRETIALFDDTVGNTIMFHRTKKKKRFPVTLPFLDPWTSYKLIGVEFNQGNLGMIT